jgi:hypothetical protein
MGVYCVNDDYCVSGTGFPTYNDVYSQSGTYNSRDYYVGSVNGYYIFYDAGSFWCLATTLGGSPCFLQGKYPYSGLCPDLTFEYVNSSVCPTPTPTATVGCDVFNFEAKLITNIDPTPSQTYTPSPTPTLTQTPTSTNVCPNIYVNAFITGITPTTTPTPTITPSVRILRYRSNQIQCNFSGDVTFVTVDSVISCPVSKQFQDCNNGFMYYTTNAVTNPSGGDLSQFMIFRGIVDGTQRCITYIGNNPTYIGTNNISLVSGPIGYSNLGECSLCAPQLTLTPTPTITMTPSSPLITNPCLTFVNGAGFISFYDVDTNTLTSLTVPNSSSWSDIANTQTKLFLSTTNRIKEWDIILNPFSATFVRELINTDSFISISSGLFAVNNNKLITANTNLSLGQEYIFEINLPLLPSTSLVYSNYTELFALEVGREFQGDILVTTNNKVLFTNSNSTGTDWYLTQHSYTTGDFEFEILISPTITSANAIFIQNSLFYITDKNGIVYNVDLNSPYTITVITSPGVVIDGASNSLSCNNISFEFTQITYYIYKLCNDTSGPQTYVYQTEPSITTVGTQTIFNLTNDTCWQYDGSSTTIPQNTTDDIIIYQGNYFTEVSSTIYTDCTDCINNLPCERPSNLQTYLIAEGLFSVSYTVDFTDIDLICGQVNQLLILGIDSVLLTSSYGNNGFSTCQAVSLELGSTVYNGEYTSCHCQEDGVYYISERGSSFPPGFLDENQGEIQDFLGGYAVRIENCVITEIIKCCYPISVRVSTNSTTICANNQGFEIFVSGDQPELYDGMTLYSDGTCLVPLTPDYYASGVDGLTIPAINYVRMSDSSYPTRYQMNNNGVITIYNC